MTAQKVKTKKCPNCGRVSEINANYACQFCRFPLFAKPANLEKTITNPVSLGTLYFGFSLSLWASKNLNLLNIIIATLGALISFVFFVAVFSDGILTFLNKKVVRYLIPTTFTASLFGFVSGWLQTVLQTSGLILEVIVYFGFAWVVVILLVMIKETKEPLRKRAGIVTAIALIAVAAIRFYHHTIIDYYSAGYLLLIAVFVTIVAIGWLKLNGTFTE